MINNIRETTFKVVYIWLTTSVALLVRHNFYLINLNQMYRKDLYLSFGYIMLFIAGSFLYSFHLYKNTNHKKKFSAASFSKDEREILVEYKSRKTAHSFYVNVLIVTIICLVFWMRPVISINYVIFYLATVTTIAEIIKSIVWINEYKN